MPTEAIDLAALDTMLTRQLAEAGAGDPVDAPAEHPLAQELRAVLTNPGAHRIGDLARVVDEILREMSMFKSATVGGGDTEG